MHATLVTLLVMGLGQAEAAAESPRPFHEMNRDLRQLIRREARATSDEERAEVIVAMTGLYRELRTDPRLPTSNTLKQYRAKLWSKLTHIQRDLEREFDLPRSTPSAESGTDKPPGARAGVIHRRQQAAQRELAELSDTITASVVQQMDLGSYSLGGPARLLGAAGGNSASGWGAAGGAGRADYGPALVELIQRTIAPNFWDVNGGPGAIVYYAPFHALVVRATGEVHGRIGGAIGGLRAAGP